MLFDMIRLSLSRSLIALLTVLFYSTNIDATEYSLQDPKTIQDEQLHKAFVLLTMKWAANSSGDFEIPVCWEPMAMASQYQNGRLTVRRAVEEQWERNSKIRFTSWGRCLSDSSGIRIAVIDEGPHVKALGRDLDGMPNGMVLNFTYLNWSQSCQTRVEYCNYSITIHEFGHALGFAHEQNRHDTPGECTSPKQGTSGDTILTPWDPHSVMNYCNPQWNNEGQLSLFDKFALFKMYGAEPISAPERFNLFLAAYRSDSPRYCDHLSLSDIEEYLVYQCGYFPKIREDRKRLYDSAIQYGWPRPCDHLSRDDTEFYGLCR